MSFSGTRTIGLIIEPSSVEELNFRFDGDGLIAMPRKEIKKILE